MKKTLLYFSIMMGLALLGYREIYKLAGNAHRDMGYAVIHVSENKPAQQMIKLQEAFKKEGKNISFSIRPNRSSGKFNIYTATDIQHLPEVADQSAINFLWIDKLKSDESPEKLRPFDVIVVKNMPAYQHLKAVNVRTAFIPDAVDVKDSEKASQTERTMFWGDGNEFSVSLSMAGHEKIKLDVYGIGFEGQWPIDEIKGTMPSETDFRSHPLVLVDQSDEDILHQTINPRIMTILENGGIPYLRYNPAIEKLFGKMVPMYHNDNEFQEQLKYLPAHLFEIEERRAAIKHLAKRWNSHSQARKFIELFEIMDRKRR